MSYLLAGVLVIALLGVWWFEVKHPGRNNFKRWE